MKKVDFILNYMLTRTIKLDDYEGTRPTENSIKFSLPHDYIPMHQ